MHIELSPRGFEYVRHPIYAGTDKDDDRLVSQSSIDRLVSQSSIVGDYPDAMQRPGTSALWVGANHHLNRAEVAKLRDRLTRWLETGSLALPGDYLQRFGEGGGR